MYSRSQGSRLGIENRNSRGRLSRSWDAPCPLNNSDFYLSLLALAICHHCHLLVCLLLDATASSTSNGMRSHAIAFFACHRLLRRLRSLVNLQIVSDATRESRIDYRIYHIRTTRWDNWWSYHDMFLLYDTTIGYDTMIARRRVQLVKF